MKIRTFLLGLLLLVLAGSHAQQLNIGTYNLRYDNPGDSTDSWQYRKAMVANMIRFYDFDILGTQEGLSNMVDDLVVALPEYGYVGVGRDDGKRKGEFSAIWYKKSRFQVIQSGTFWLNGENIHQPIKGWDAVLPRICTWVKLKEKKTGKLFYHFNTHFDHVGINARVESAKLIMAQIKKIAGDKANISLTGDFNVDQHSENYKVINSSGILQDAYTTTPVKLAPNGTFNAFNINAHTDSRIDHIFLGHAYKPYRYGILTNIYWSTPQAEHTASNNFPDEVHLEKAKARIPSDHYPVFVQVGY